MTHASLFSGIGAPELAAEWCGWENLFNCEIDPFCRRILNYHFPNTKQYADIKTTDFTPWRGIVDVLSGGFPCQPFSVAGKRQGTEDDRYLWPEMLRAIREIRPRWIVGENVLGIVSWSNGMVFEQVCSDLENEGYEVQPYIIPACAVGAPHQRYRTWFVAHRTDAGIKTKQEWATNICRPCAASDAYGIMLEHRNGEQQKKRRIAKRVKSHNCTCDWSQFPTQPPICGRDDGLSARLDGITFSAWRKRSIKAYGNAIVPQVIYQIYQTIDQCGNNE